MWTRRKERKQLQSQRAPGRSTRDPTDGRRMKVKLPALRTSLVVQWLRLRVPKAGGPGFVPWSGN